MFKLEDSEIMYKDTNRINNISIKMRDYPNANDKYETLQKY